MIAPDWLWIPVTLGAAIAQTLRNAAQRHLTPVLGTLGATLVRFLYGLPFAALWFLVVRVAGDDDMPAANGLFLAWIVMASLAQIAATALLLRVMAERNFALGVAYAKSEVLQIAVFGLLFLGDPLTAVALFAVVLGTLGVLMLSPPDRERPLGTLVSGWTTRPALLGMASGAGFAVAAVGYRGAALALEGTPFLMAAAYTLVAAQALQTVLLGGWLLARNAGVVVRVLREWRRSVFAGSMGAVASACWFTAFVLQPAAHVRTLGLVEIFFSYAVSRHFFREAITRVEVIGMALLAAAVALISFAR
ncbi:MAG: EamA/RhaT family transporter [Rhodospirillaceae bacterium]